MSSDDSINQGSVCLKHPNKPAVARCAVCRKPICADCVMQRDGMVFCSPRCMATGLKSVGDVAQIMNKKKKSESMGLLRNIVRLVILALLVFAGYYFRKPIKQQWDKWFNKSVDTLHEQKEEGDRKFDNQIERVQRKQHGKKYDAINED